MSELFFNVAGMLLRSMVNGPGLRSVVWVQGCTIGCPGCFNPHTQAHTAKYLLDPRQLGRTLNEVPDICGITISGGEPFEQAAACAVLASEIQAAGRTVMVFTGYTYAQLSASTMPEVRRFLAAIDLLVAGPYVEHLKTDGKLWRASENQTVHLLTERMKLPATAGPNEPVVEVVIDGAQMTATGFPDASDLEWLKYLTPRAKEPAEALSPGPD